MNERDPDLERLLDVARTDRPPEGVADATWAALAIRVAPSPATVDGTGASSGIEGAAGTSLAKSAPVAWVIGLGGLAIAAVVAGALLRRPSSDRTREVVEAAQPVSQADEAPVLGAPDTEPTNGEPNVNPSVNPNVNREPEPGLKSAIGAATPETAKTREVEPPPASVPKPDPRPDDGAGDPRRPAPPQPEAPAQARCPDLAAEAQLFATMSAQLRDGEATGALATVGQWRRDCTDPQLREEVSAVEILALCEAGRGTQALRRADRFVDRWPSSALEHRLVGSCAGSAFSK